MLAAISNTNKKISLFQKSSALILFFGLLVFVGFAFSGTAHAETDTAIAASAPTPNSGTTDTGANFTPITGVGRGQFDGTYMWYKIYIKIGQSTTININQTCADSFGSPTVDYQIETLSDVELDYQGDFTGGQIYPNDPISSSDCSQRVSFPIAAKYGRPATGIKGHENYRVFALLATMEQGPGSAEQYFTVTSTNGGGNSYVGMARPDFTFKPLKFSTVYKTSGTWSTSVMFAPRCDQTLPDSVSIQIFDPDNGIYQNNMAAFLEHAPSGSSPPYPWTTQTSWSASTVQGGAWGTSGTTSTLSFKPSDNFIYKFHVTNSSHPNTIQIKLPFDQFDASRIVKSTCVPNAKCTANGVTNFVQNNMTAGQTTQVKYVFTNTGTTTWHTNDDPLTQYRRSVNGSWFSPITIPNNVSPGNSFSITITETAPSVGSKNIAYTMWQSGVGGFGSICSASLNVGTFTTGGPNSIATSCLGTAVQFTTTAQENYKSYQQAFNPPFWTVEVPQGGNPDGTFWYDHVPANANIPVPVGSANTTLYNGVLYYKASYQMIAPQPSKPAKDVPFYVVWKDASGNQVGSPTTGIATPTNSSGYIVYNWNGANTFSIFNYLRPHNAYTAELYAVVSGTFTKDDPSTYAYSTSPLGTTSLPQCFEAVNNPTDTNYVCVGSTNPTTATPGQNVNFTYTIKINNKTNIGFGPGYQLVAHPDGQGVRSTGNDVQNINFSPGAGFVTAAATYTFTVYYQGSYSVELTYNGVRIADLPGGWSGTCGGGTITPSVTPYFQVWNNDAAAGGGFSTLANQCPTTYPDYVSPVTASSLPNSDNYGGIRAFSSSSYKSKTDFGAVALGLIPGSTGGPTGFFAKQYFSNNPPSGSLGGYLDSNSSGHCVPDYYDKTRYADEANTTSLPQNDLNQAVSNCAADSTTGYRRCQYQTSGADLSGGTVTIPAGVQITLYVDGDITIDTNIVYSNNFDPTKRASVPYLAIIARGNITLTDNVTRLDGLYVAQPSSSGNDGNFNTCDDSCTQQLVINGAVIAQHVNLLRAHGASQPLVNDINGIGNTPAEIINFSPAMILGAPVFNPDTNAPEGIFSLPPVF